VKKLTPSLDKLVKACVFNGFSNEQLLIGLKCRFSGLKNKGE
jgi:hypothetical protein